jgi:hypothetical protein
MASILVMDGILPGERAIGLLWFETLRCYGLAVKTTPHPALSP